jgi:hypothetical protein
MRIDKILGKVIAITRGIHLTAVPSSARVDVFTPAGFRQVQWWFSHNAIVETRELAEMIRELDTEYAEANVAAIQLEIDSVLKASFLDSTLFDLRKIKIGKSALFDAALGDVTDFARNLWEKILAAVKDLQPSWLILYPLRGVVANSIDVGFGGLSVMAPTDIDKWQNYASRYPEPLVSIQLKDLRKNSQRLLCGA